MKKITAMKRARRRGASFPELARRYGLAVGTVHKLCTTDLRVLCREVTA